MVRFRMARIILLLLSLLLLLNSKGQEQRFAHQDILKYFTEIQAATKKSYRLWGVDLYGPILLVDPSTRQTFANEADSMGFFKRDNNIFSGTLPDNVNIANTSIDFGGKRWAMVMLSLPQDKKDRINLLAHELFHAKQPILEFVHNNPENNHLDQLDGRIYLRLELEALKKAIQASSKRDVQRHVSDALAFRKYRYLLYPGADSTENLLELNEGLAEFTGFMVSKRTRKEAKEYVVRSINAFLTNPTYVRSFAYCTIPVYGYLLFRKSKTWNKAVRTDTDLTALFSTLFAVDLPEDLAVVTMNLSDCYNGAVIVMEETARAEKTKRLVAEYKRRFIEQPHLEIPFEQMNVSFDPRSLVPVEDHGTVYPTIRVTDRWGLLVVENGALMSTDWAKISLTIPLEIGDKKVQGDGWILTLVDGYSVKKDEKSGNYVLLKRQ